MQTRNAFELTQIDQIDKIKTKNLGADQACYIAASIFGSAMKFVPA